MRKEKLKANFKGNRSIPNRDTTRPENIQKTKQTDGASRAGAACRKQSPRFLGIFAPSSGSELALQPHVDFTDCTTSLSNHGR